MKKNNNKKPKPEYKVKTLDHLCRDDMQKEIDTDPIFEAIFNEKYSTLEDWYDITGVPCKEEEMYKEAYVIAKKEYKEKRGVK